MKFFSKTKTRRLAVTIALGIILALVLGATPSQAGPCERALGRCLIDAGMASVVSLIASGGLSAAILGQFCFSGYLFCVAYCI